MPGDYSGIVPSSADWKALGWVVCVVCLFFFGMAVWGGWILHREYAAHVEAKIEQVEQ